MYTQVTPMAVKMALRRLIARENMRRAETGAADLTQQDIAAGAGLSQSVVSKLLNAKTSRIDFDTMNGLCRFFGVLPGDLFDYIPDPDTPTADA